MTTTSIDILQGPGSGARNEPDRRAFLQSAIAAAATSFVIPEFARHAHATHSDDTIRIGLVGCGGRGTGAAVNALRADKNVRLVALADLFPERIESSLGELQKKENGVAEKVAVDADHRFSGFDCTKNLLDSGVDVILLCSPPHFRPAQIELAVEKGCHVFAEKPIAVDAPGLRRVLAACEQAKAKRLNVVSGLCWRYDSGMRATFQKVHDGAIGEITSLQCSYNTGSLWMHPRKPEWSDMEWQLRNWLYFTWLSGDHIVEQHIHSIDKVQWALKDAVPLRATGMGGRQVRTDAAYGHIYDHFATVFEYANGVRAYSFCRQQDGCANDVSDHIFGTAGHCDVFKHRIEGTTPWRFDGKKTNMYQVEHDELFAAIRSGNPINNGDYMCKSTMVAIMGRMAAYTGQSITYDQALNSTEDLTPGSYAFTDLPTPPVPMPGFTKFL